MGGAIYGPGSQIPQVRGVFSRPSLIQSDINAVMVTETEVAGGQEKGPRIKGITVMHGGRDLDPGIMGDSVLHEASSTAFKGTWPMQTLSSQKEASCDKEGIIPGDILGACSATRAVF